VFTREQGFHPESTKVTPTGITLKGVLDIFLGGVLAERHSVEQGLGVQELDIQNLVCENGSVDAKRVHHAHGVDEAAVDDSARFHREHKDISVWFRHQTPSHKHLAEFVMERKNAGMRELLDWECQYQWIKQFLRIFGLELIH